MYELTQTPFGAHTRYTFRQFRTGNGFSIVPGAGANVLDIQFQGQNILDGYATPEELAEGKWGKSTLLFPFPNRLDLGRYVWNGKTYQFPINNAATGNAIHGFVRDMPFEVEYALLTQEFARIRCNLDYAGTLPYYPFPFYLELEFTMHNLGKFELAVEVTNLHHEPIPIGFGWHPYFKLTENADTHALGLPACDQVLINERMIPTGARSNNEAFKTLRLLADTHLDTCFQVRQKRGAYALTLKAGNRQLNVKAPAEQFPYFQVFTPPHRASVALEPMTCNVDAFNNGEGLKSLGAGERWKGRVNIACKDA